MALNPIEKTALAEKIRQICLDRGYEKKPISHYENRVRGFDRTFEGVRFPFSNEGSRIFATRMDAYCLADDAIKAGIRIAGLEPHSFKYAFPGYAGHTFFNCKDVLIRKITDDICPPPPPLPTSSPSSSPLPAKTVGSLMSIAGAAALFRIVTKLAPSYSTPAAAFLPPNVIERSWNSMDFLRACYDPISGDAADCEQWKNQLRESKPLQIL